MTFACGSALGLRWDDWAVGNPTDYDVYIWDDLANVFDFAALKAWSGDDQTVAPPVENFSLSCSGGGDVDYLVVSLWDPGDGMSGDVLELGINGLLEYWQASYSAAIPFGDTFNPGAVSVGAVDPPTGTAIAFYSSRGPTNDTRIKPDLSAPAGMTTFSSGAFSGTSAAAPVVAGAAALLFDAGLVVNPTQLKTYLLSSAVIDRGSAGPDDDYGAGELYLGDPPNRPPVGVDDPYDATEDMRLVVAASGVLSNDTDPDGDPMTVAASDVVSVKGGTVAVVADGSFTYDPPVEFNGVDSFDYTVSDGALTDTATVTISVSAVPDAPVAFDDAYAATKNTQLSKNAASGVLFNDTDVDGDGLTVAAFDATSTGGGSLAVGPDGSFTYDPRAGFTGIDTFTYTVSDGALTDTATVTITVSGPPSPPPPPYFPPPLPPAGTCPEALPGAGFDDLGGYSTEIVDAISCLGAYAISLGTSPSKFSPNLPVTRWQMALFLTRQITAHGISLPSTVDQGFVDIPSLSAATQDAINRLAVLGITKGTTATTFDPHGLVTRWQMALFLTRVADIVEIPLSGSPARRFLDFGGLPAETRRAIDQLAEAGIVKGTSPTTFDPDGHVRRWQMALFLTRVLKAGGVALPKLPNI
jgi:hypothetical protein